MPTVRDKNWWLPKKRKDVEVSVHAELRLEERLGLTGASYATLQRLACEVWDRQIGPDPAWKVPRVNRSLRYLGHRNHVWVYEVIKREHLHKKSAARLVTVVGPFSEGMTWKTYTETHKSLSSSQ